MPPLDWLDASLAIRWVHVVTMAVVVGGAALTWASLRAFGTRDVAAALQVARAYEWLFWGAVGLAVLTGVGNLGGLAPSVPGPGTRWGVTLAVKLVAVGVLLLLSVPRTLATLGGWFGPMNAAVIRRLRVGYAATAVYLVAVVGLAEVLAHG